MHAFDDACKKCPPGYMFKAFGNGWSEYTIQYGRDANGELYWTAGGTAGGPLDKDMIERERKLNLTYCFFQKRQHVADCMLPTFEEVYHRIREADPEVIGKNFIKKVHEVINKRIDNSIEGGVDPEVARTLCNGAARDVLGLIDTETQRGAQVYNFTINRNGYQANVAGLLVGLFDTINS